MTAALAFTIPLRVENTSNKREHWRARAARIKRERLAARVAFLDAAAREPVPPLPVVVELVRRSVGTLDDDNLRSALKAVRDEVAASLGVDDRDPRVRWAYEQEPAPFLRSEHRVIAEKVKGQRRKVKRMSKRAIAVYDDGVRVTVRVVDNVTNSGGAA